MARGRSRPAPPGRPVGALDIGTSKIACIVGQTLASDSVDPAVQILGAGLQRSRGITAGVVTDPTAAEAAIRACVAQAERSAGVSLGEVYLTLSAGRIASRTFAVHADIGPNGIGGADISRLVAGGRAYAERDGRALVHMNKTAFEIDGAPGADDPRGLAARRLTARLHAVTADESAIRNLIQTVERCHLAVAGVVATPYASALAVTTAQDRMLGVTVVDLGAGTTTLARFREGQLVQTEALASGGYHLTFEIAQKLHASLAEAERIKTLYASMVNAQSDVCDRFSVVVAGGGEEAMRQVSRAELAAMVQPRVEHLLRWVDDRLAAAGGEEGLVLLTGGASALAGLAGYAAFGLRREVRPVRPRTGIDNAGHAAVVGLVLAAAGADAVAWDEAGAGRGYLGRVGRWFASGF